MPARPVAATIVDVARAAGVSTATAARAVGGYGSVRPATRDAVRSAAAALGYRVNSLARSVVTGRSQTLGIVVADVENPFFARLTRGFGDVARRAGFDVVLLNTDEDPAAEQRALALLLDRRVDAVALTPSSVVPSRLLLDAVSDGPPVLLLDRQLPGLDVDSVGIDNQAAARQAVTRLVGLGHRRIGMVTGVLTAAPPGGCEVPFASSTNDRIRGYRSALRAAGLPAAAELLHRGDFRRDSARRATAGLLRLADPPTALCATDSTLALGVLQGLADAGLRVPDDVSLVAFDDADWTTVVSPPLSVVAQPAYELGSAAAERLLARLDGDAGPSRALRLPTRFVERGSVAQAPAPPRISSTATGSGRTTSGRGPARSRRTARSAPGAVPRPTSPRRGAR